MLAHDLPVIVIPIAADRLENAARCTVLVLGNIIQRAELTPERLRHAVLEVLAAPTYRVATKRLLAQIDALRGPDYAALLERLAVERQPLTYSG